MDTYSGPLREDVDLEKYPTAKVLVERCKEFIAEVQNLTPGAPLETRLNKSYGPGTPYYDSFATLVRQGIINNEGWCATIPIDGAKYRRSKLALPSAETGYMSITTVYMESQEEYSGKYHQHPYGEINCVILMDEKGGKAELKGMSGWQGAGWTSPGAGTHHYPEVRGGALVALFFLPAGRISYEAHPGMDQPVMV